MTPRWYTEKEVAELHHTIELLRRAVNILQDESSKLRTDNKLLQTRNTFLVTEVADLNRQLTLAKQQSRCTANG
jgi:cell division protein FtsB